MPSAAPTGGSVPAGLTGHLESLVGPDRVLLSPTTAIYGLRPAVEVRPTDELQLSNVLELAGETDIGVCVAGGGTKLGWGNRPARFDLQLSTAGLRGTWDVDVDNLSLSVSAGFPVAEARAKAWEMGRILPLGPCRPGAATVGGVTATADQGARGAGYGGVRDVVLGIRAILADGSPVKFGGRTMKNVSGYDMTKLFVESLGVLGVITEVTFRLLPRPERQALVTLPLRSLGQAEELVAEMLNSYLQPLVLEVISSAFARSAGLARGAEAARTAAATAEVRAAAGNQAANEAGVASADGAARSAIADLCSRGDYLLLAGFAGHPAAVARSITEVSERSRYPDPVILEDPDAESLLDHLADAEAVLADRGPFLGTRASVPISHAWSLAEAAESLAQALHLPLAFRVGAARGTVDLYLQGASGGATEQQRFTAFAEGARREAAALGGQLWVMNGLSLLSPDFDSWGDAGPGVRLMRRLKDQFDPRRMLNAGRFVGRI